MTPSILTHTGILWDLANPDPERVSLRDIAHALARIIRYTGHGDQVFTDAQHSVLVSALCPAPLQRWGLLHDAHEAYTGDVSGPMKCALRQGFSKLNAAGHVWAALDAIECDHQRAVSLRFGVQIADVKWFDDQAALLEVQCNGPHSSEEFTWPEPSVSWPSNLPSGVWGTELAEFLFLTRCAELGIK